MYYQTISTKNKIMKNLIFISVALFLFSCEKEAIKSSSENNTLSKISKYDTLVIHTDTTTSTKVIVTNDCISFAQTAFQKGCRFELAEGQGTYPYDVVVEYLVETSNSGTYTYGDTVSVVVLHQTDSSNTYTFVTDTLKTKLHYPTGEYAIYDMGYVIIKAGHRVSDRELEFVQANNYIVTIKSTTPAVPFSTSPLKFTVISPVPSGGWFNQGLPK